MEELTHFLDSAKRCFNAFADGVSQEELLKAANIIWEAESNGNRIHITGIGKPGHVAGYVASLMSSTGTPTYFLHGTEAVHGSCGQLVPGDVVICISNSGETAETHGIRSRQIPGGSGPARTARSRRARSQYSRGASCRSPRTG